MKAQRSMNEAGTRKCANWTHQMRAGGVVPSHNKWCCADARRMRRCSSSSAKSGLSESSPKNVDLWHFIFSCAWLELAPLSIRASHLSPRSRCARTPARSRRSRCRWHWAGASWVWGRPRRAVWRRRVPLDTRRWRGIRADRAAAPRGVRNRCRSRSPERSSHRCRGCGESVWWTRWRRWARQLPVRTRITGYRWTPEGWRRKPMRREV